MFKKLLTLLLPACTLFTNALAQTQNQVILQGSISNRTLNADSCYYLKGCVRVQNGTLTIPAGTRIFGINDAFARPGTLIIETSGYIIANGTSGNPIIFTSGKAAGSRAPGDWAGIIIAGETNVDLVCKSWSCCEMMCLSSVGGANDTDSSGSMSYVQIHYAGDRNACGSEIGALTMFAVGSKTQIHHIQVTNAYKDAFAWFGGTVNLHHLVAYNTNDDDFDTDLGYRGKVQFGLGLRLDTAAHDISRSHGIESDNNQDGASDYTCGTYVTRPVFSNFTLVGPRFCGIGTVNAAYESAIQIRRNSEQTIYNSIITGWNQGLRIDDRNPDPVTAGFDPTANNTLNNLLNFSYNTFANSGTAALSTGNSWVANGCSISILGWLGLAAAPAAACKEAGNQSLAVNPTSWSSLCGNFCSARPDFSVGGATNVSAATFTGVSDLGSGFDVVSYRGAFGTTDWTLSWTDWCPQTTNYNCGTSPLRPAAFTERATATMPKLTFVPNPTDGTTYALFNTTHTGKAQLNILDKVNGKALVTVNHLIQEAGEQRISFNAGGLREGIYFVQIVLENGMILGGQLSVR